jgi:hypothetical protein
MQYSDQLLATEKNMEGIISSIQETFIQAECGNAPIIQLLGEERLTFLKPYETKRLFHFSFFSEISTIHTITGNKSGIQPRNAGLCLNVIEHRITELFYDKGILEVRKSVEEEGNPLPAKNQLVWQGGVKPKPSGGPFKPKVMITGRIDPTG